MRKQSTNSHSKDWLNDFVERNGWPIIVAILGLTFWMAVLYSEVRANTNDIITLKNLVERVIVLEERSRTELEMIQEIKADIKEIKAAVK